MKNTTEVQKTNKTIVLVAGDKGGVGKSCLARAIASYLIENGVRYRGYDGDDTNPTFFRFFPDVQRIHTKSPKGFEALINGLEGDEPCQLADLGAGTSIVLGQFIDQTGFLELAASYGSRIVFVFVLAPGADSAGLLQILAERYGNKVTYVIARSNAIPGTWDLWEGSKTRKRLLEDLGAVEIAIPALDAEAFSLADRHSLQWTAAATDKRLPLACRSYVHRWINKVYVEFGKVPALTGQAT